MTRLQAKVAAVNKANKYATALSPELNRIFQPFVGQKIEKADGELLAKVAKLLPIFPSEVNVFQRRSNYSLGWGVQASVTASDGIAMYYEVTVYVGDMKDGVLENLSKLYQGCCDYTAEGVLEKRVKFAAVEKLYNVAKDDLWPFGEYDR